MTTSSAWEGLRQIAPLADFLSGHGRMGLKMKAMDWSGTALGPPESWSQSLKSAVLMMLASKQPICLCWGPELSTLYNNSYAPFLGRKEQWALGQPFEKIWEEIWDDLLPLVRQALSGQGTWSENLPLYMNRNGYEEETYWTFSYSPLYDETGQIAGMINIASDSTATVFTQRDLIKSVADAQQDIAEYEVIERQQRILQREMAHRIKNTLSMTMAIVSQTMRHSQSISEANETISNRISALANAQEILTATASGSVGISGAVSGALKPHIDGSERVTTNGPDITISAQQALGLSLAIHELATNAAKYGALSTAAGRVTITWSRDEQDHFQFVWQEQQGPAVEAPARSGFGSRLTSRIVAAYFSGRGQTFYEPGGVRYVLEGTINRPSDENAEPIDGPAH